MSFRKDYVMLISFYIVMLLYIAIFGNQVVTIIFLTILFITTMIVYSNIRITVFKDKEEKVSTLKHRLKETKKENEETYKRFLSLSKTLGSGVFMVDEDGVITFSNKDMENYFEVDFTDKEYKEYKDIPELNSFYKFIDKAYIKEEHFQKQIIFNDRIFNLISTPLFEGDIFAGTLILVHDITAIKNAEKFQKQFTADVSHELKTPLSAIKGFSEILLRDDKISDKSRNEFIGLISKESERMEIILKDLMSISKLDRIDYELDIQDNNIKEVIDEVLGLLEGKFKDKNIERQREIEDCTFGFDKLKISQVLINIVKNAINYTDAGYVQVKGYTEESDYVIEIRDSGIGIKESDYEKIFKRFYRVDKARSRDTGGSGLGLSISKNVITKHGGSISVESEESKGSIFRIMLPINEDHSDD